jgi:hypothetical protein
MTGLEAVSPGLVLGIEHYQVFRFDVMHPVAFGAVIFLGVQLALVPVGAGNEPGFDAVFAVNAAQR